MTMISFVDKIYPWNHILDIIVKWTYQCVIQTKSNLHLGSYQVLAINASVAFQQSYGIFKKKVMNTYKTFAHNSEFVTLQLKYRFFLDKQNLGK